MPTKLRCHDCGYVWDYHGDLQRATCPSCQAKVDTEKHRVEA